jgi:hypothetical protein
VREIILINAYHVLLAAARASRADDYDDERLVLPWFLPQMRDRFISATQARGSVEGCHPGCNFFNLQIYMKDAVQVSKFVNETRPDPTSIGTDRLGSIAKL